MSDCSDADDGTGHPPAGRVTVPAMPGLTNGCVPDCPGPMRAAPRATGLASPICARMALVIDDPTPHHGPMHPTTSSRLDWLLFVLLGFFWGSSYLFIKIGVDA